MKKYKKIFLLSNFNLELLANFLEKNLKEKNFIVENSEYNQINQFLRSKKNNKNIDNILFVWLSAYFFIPELINYKKTTQTKNEIFEKTDEFIEMIKKKSEEFEYILMPQLFIDGINRENNIQELKSEFSQKNLVDEINMRIKKKLISSKNIFLIDTIRWFNNFGNKSFDRKMWYYAKIPFSFNFLKYISDEISSTIKDLYEINKKLIILDLDNTLWGGVLGDLGYRGINIGGHDPQGEAFQDFQKEILKLKNKGIVLAICSKNNKINVDEVFEKNKNMILKSGDFVFKSINWNDKAENIKLILKKLNLTSSSAIFIDDSKHERDRVKSVFKDITVLEISSDPTTFVDTLLEVENLSSVKLTNEDKSRTKMYQDEGERENLKIKIKSNLEWLKELKINLNVEKLNDINFDRSLQLLNKTNQMNLKTNRYSDRSLKNYLKKKNNYMFAFEVTDKFGSSGITCIVGLTKKNKNIIISDFVMSCRVFGRGIEFAILNFISEFAKKIGAKFIEFKYIKTKKNSPTLNFLEKSKMKKEANIYIWDNKSIYVKPKYIKLKHVK